MPQVFATQHSTVVPTLTPRPRLERLVTELVSIKSQIAALDTAKHEIQEKLLIDADRAGGRIETDEWTLMAVDSESSTIKKEKLLELGVKPSVIRRATEHKPYRYVKLTMKE